MDKKSMKKYIILALVVAFIAGSIATGSPFNLIDMIIVRPIVNIQFMIFNLVHDFGLAIVILAILVKLFMWPLTKRQLVQTRLMQKIQPELVKIRKNCNGNKQLESLQTMDLYKRYNVKPFASILVLIIQLPIFIAVFSAIRVIATPMPQDNLNNRAYDFVAYEGSEIKSLEDKQQEYLEKLESMSDEEKKSLTVEQSKKLYDFDPKLFNTIDLTAKASDVINPARFSWSAVFMLVISIAAALAQYFVAKQQSASGKSEKKKKFREILKEAKEGKEVDDSDISSLTTGQMSKMMPIMMFVIMFNLHGALAFYYFLSNIFTILQQKLIFNKVRDEMDDNTDKAILKELKKSESGKSISKGTKKIKEAEVVENKKTGTKITRISAKDNKKKRR
ncbi:MAG: YidC/Oxa1 family membrane protein insertase [Candidatus Saccharibacteria bacterium]|nr:YidC/Oxa1 family membrane protein insertase [Candidatus Saccharibacteria bacterium]